MVTALLEGSPSRGYLAVGEARAPLASILRAAPSRGFTLSQSLGHMATCVHTGLLAAVAAERGTGVLGSVLCALCALLGAAPYERLPAPLLPEALGTLRARWAALGGLERGVAMGGGLQGGAAQASGLQVGTQSGATVGVGQQGVAVGKQAGTPDSSPAGPVMHPSELSSLHAAYLACVAELLAVKPPSASLLTLLASPTAQPPYTLEPAATVAQHIIEELLSACYNAQVGAQEWGATLICSWGWLHIEHSHFHVATN